MEIGLPVARLLVSQQHRLEDEPGERANVICPNAVAWGDVATWVTGAGTLFVGALAYRGSRQAAQIAAEAKQIAQQQLDHDAHERAESARITGRLLLNEVSGLPPRLTGIIKALLAAIDWADRPSIKNESAFLFALSEAARPKMPGAESVLDRVHHLPDSIGADLATLIGQDRTLREFAAHLNEKVQRVSHPLDHLVYSGDSRSFRLILEQLVHLTELAMQFAPEFQSSVGMFPQRYDDCEPVLKVANRHTARELG